MLNEEKETSIMQIQLLDEETYWMKRSVFLVMDSELDWVHAYWNKVCGKYPNLNATIRKVKHV